MADLYELGLFVAWHAAMWGRAKTLPSWESVQKKLSAKTSKTDGQQDWREVRANMAALRQQQKGQPVVKPAEPKRRRRR